MRQLHLPLSMCLLLIVLPMAALATAIELPNDSDTLLLLRFNGTLQGVAGENPTSSAGITYQTGLSGSAAHVADPGYIRYSRSGNIISTEGTVEFWIKPDWNGDDDPVTQFFFQVGNSFDNGMLLSIDGANNLRFIQWGDDPSTPEVETGVERGCASYGGGWQAGNWYHFAATWNGTTHQMRLYVNGQLVSSEDSGVYISSFSTTWLTVGADIGNGQPALATFEEFRISDRARTAGEILTDYYAGLGMTVLAAPQGIAVDSTDRTVVAETDAHRVRVYDDDGVEVLTIGSYGTGNGQFDQPWDVTTSNIDHIYVADTGNDRVQRFNAAGAYQSQFGSPGTAAGQFTEPKGIAYDPGLNRLYVADTGNHRVQRFTVDGVLDAAWGVGGVVGTTGTVKRDHTGFDRPMDVAVNPTNGNVYVADYGNCRLEVFNGSGAYVRTYLAVYRPNGLCFDDNGDLYIAGDDPNNGYTYYDGRLRLLRAGQELIGKHYTGGLDDLGRVQGGVALRSDGSIVLSDPFNGRIAATDHAFTPPLSDLEVIPAGTSVTFKWKTVEPGPTSVRYGPTTAYGSSATDPAPTTVHSITVSGQTPNTVLYYGVSLPDSFNGTQRWTPDDLLNTGVAPGQTQFMRLKCAGMIYLDTDPGASYVPMTPAQILEAHTRFDTVAKFYWRNSGFKLWLDYTVVEVSRNLTTPLSIWDCMESDLAAAGYSALDDFDAVHGTSVCATGNFGGGGGLFGRSIGTCQMGGLDDWVAIHEISHAVDSTYGQCGLSKYEFNHGIWAVPNGLGRDFAINGQILRNMLPANYPALRSPYTKTIAAPDANNDGVPDSSPGGLTTPISITEATLGSSTASADTDNDGLSDLAEAMALYHHNTSLTTTDSDGDGDPDGLDLNPAYRVKDRIVKGTPTINGSIGTGEAWTVLTQNWGFSNDSLMYDSNAYQALTITYAAWDNNYLYLALKGPATETTVKLDGSADNWFISPDNYLLTLRNDVSSYSVSINVGVPDIYRQIDDGGQFSEFFDTDPKFILPYNGHNILTDPGDGLGFPGRLVTEANLTYARGGTGNNRIWELRIPWSNTTLLKGFAGKEIAIQFIVSDDLLFECDHAARFRLVESTPPEITAVTEGPDGAVTLTFTSTDGAHYDLLYTDDRASGTWRLLDRVTAHGPTTAYTDDGTKTSPHPANALDRFYKIRP